MARRKRADKKKLIISLLIVVAIAAVMSFSGTTDDSGTGKNTTAAPSPDGITTSQVQGVHTSSEGVQTLVHFIDIGQGSATLVTSGDKAMLIDTGESDYSDTLVSYINSCGISELEYVIASHPHSDHIGGMVDIIENFSVDTLIMPELTDINTPTTRVYENMLDAIIEHDIYTVASEVGDIYRLGSTVSFEILGPCTQVSDLNNMSVMVKLDANGTDFMILGDAEKQELELVYNNYPHTDYSCEVLVMGHHGSRTSLYEDFLSAVAPETAVISCGRDNSYGHPHDEALEYVRQKGLEIFRTDLDGDIIFECTEEGYERIEDR